MKQTRMSSQGPLTTEHHQMENNENKGGSIDPDDPLLIAQSLTYVTDDGSVIMSYSSAPFSFGEHSYNDFSSLYHGCYKISKDC